MLLALAAGLALSVDMPVARRIERGDLPGDLTRLVRLSEAFAFGGTVAIILLVAATLDPRGWRVLPRLAASAFGAGLAADLVKLLVARMRPAEANLAGAVRETFLTWLPLWHGDSIERMQLEYGHGLQSFPSGHTATAVGLAVALATLYPRGGWLFALLATLAGFQRIQSQSHFTSDVLAGAAIGCLVGAVCHELRLAGGWFAKVESASASRISSAGPQA